MALADIEAAIDSGIPHRTCAVCHYISERGDEWATRLRRLLANRGVKFRDLAAELAKDPDEPTIEWQALSRHARGHCAAKDVLR
jgi:hypothetical protein